MTRPVRLLWLFAFALFARAVLPAGWMPSALPGQLVMLCTDAGLQQAWVDDDGKLHKSDPDSGQHDNSPCAFAGLGLASAAPPLETALAAPVLQAPEKILPRTVVAIGHGLAAPPPPKTGPPAAA